MDDKLFREHVIKAFRDVHLYCNKIRHEKCDGCLLWRTSNDEYDYGFCAASGDSPANWDVEGIAERE